MSSLEIEERSNLREEAKQRKAVPPSTDISFLCPLPLGSTSTYTAGPLLRKSYILPVLSQERAAPTGPLIRKSCTYRPSHKKYLHYRPSLNPFRAPKPLPIMHATIWVHRVFSGVARFGSLRHLPKSDLERAKTANG